MSVEEYAELAAVLSLFMILSVPTQTLGTMLLRYVSKFKAEGREEQIRWLIRVSLKIALIIGVAIAALIVIFMQYLIDFLSITSQWPIIILLVGIIVAMVSPVGYGPTQGLQRFLALGINSIMGSVGKLGFGIILVLIGFGVSGALGAVVIGSVFAMMVTFYSIKDYLTGKSSPITAEDARSIKFYILPVTVAIVSYTIMTNIDIVLANHFLTKPDAGLYSVASTIGKIILFLPGAIALVMFPKISDAHTKKTETIQIMRRSIFWTLVLSGVIALGYLLLPGTVLGILSGAKFVDAAPILAVLGVAFMFFGLASLFMNYGLATDGHAYIVFFSFFTAFEIALLMLWHDTPLTIAYDMLAASSLLCAVSWIYMELRQRAYMIGR